MQAHKLAEAEALQVRFQVRVAQKSGSNSHMGEVFFNAAFGTKHEAGKSSFGLLLLSEMEGSFHIERFALDGNCFEAAQ